MAYRLQFSCLLTTDHHNVKSKQGHPSSAAEMTCHTKHRCSRRLCLLYAICVCLQTSSNLKARLQRAEVELQVDHSKQQHLQLQLDSATAESSALAGELESELDNVAQLVAESQEEYRQRMEVCNPDSTLACKFSIWMKTLVTLPWKSARLCSPAL